MKLIFDADPQHVLLEAGKEVHGGESFNVSRERGEVLRADPYASVRSPRKSDTEKSGEESGSSSASS